MNHCTFSGRTTKDIELKQTTNGKSYARFSLAVDGGYGDNKHTDFFNMTVWGKRAETMSNYVPKGTKIIVESEARQSKYKDKDGNDVTSIDFNVLNFEFCESKSASQTNSATQSATQMSNDEFMNIPDGADEESPFR